MSHLQPLSPAAGAALESSSHRAASASGSFIPTLATRSPPFARTRSNTPTAASLPQLIAPDPRFLAQAHVHVTPEAAIFHGDAISQPVLWHGRIDDRYLTFGTQRPAATRHDLADALNAALAGRQPAPPAAPPVGCAIIPRA